MTKNSFIVYHNYREKLKTLSDAQLGKLFRAMLNYSITGAEPKLAGAVKMAFQFIKVTMDEDKQKYNSICEKRKESGSIGGKQKVANASNCKQKVASVADNDNDYDYSLSNNNKYIYLSARARACESEKDIKEFLKENFKSYFNYWGYDEEEKQLFDEVMQVIANAIKRAKGNDLKFYLMHYDLDKLLKDISVLDEDDIHSIVWQLLNSNEIRNRYSYILGALLSRANEKAQSGVKNEIKKF